MTSDAERGTDLTRAPIQPHDRTWLHMDRPNNLMYIHSLMWFRDVPDWDGIADVYENRMAARFPVFRRRPVKRDDGWHWEDDPDFDISRHLSHTVLDGDMDDLRAYVSRQMSVPLPSDRPLWTVEFIEGVDGVEGGRGSFTLARFHHGIADGIRMTQVLLSMCDAVEGPPPARVGAHDHPHDAFAVAAFVGKHALHDGLDLAGGSTRAVLHAPETAAHLVSGTWNRIRRGKPSIKGLPIRTVEAIASLSSEDNTVMNTWRSTTRLLVAPRANDFPWSGTPGEAKAAAWIEGIDLKRLRAMARRQHGTVNDVLFGAVSLALTDYLRASMGEMPGDDVNWLVPVALRPLDEDLPEDLGNYFSVVMMRMPIGIDDPLQAVAQCREMMQRIKHSAEPQITFGLQRVVATTPKPFSRAMTNYFANKAIGQLTSVPGPTIEVSLGGNPVAGMLGWVPMSGDQSLGICIYSYNGRVAIGLACDARLVPDPETLADMVTAAVDRIDAASQAAVDAAEGAGRP
ncbi:WS/DGAT domain-containing protein [Actinomycetota bacterium]